MGEKGLFLLRLERVIGFETEDLMLGKNRVSTYQANHLKSFARAPVPLEHGWSRRKANLILAAADWRSGDRGKRSTQLVREKRQPAGHRGVGRN